MSQINFYDYIDSLPSPITLREHLSRNVKERDLLKRLLRLSEQRENLQRPGSIEEKSVARKVKIFSRPSSSLSTWTFRS